MRWINAPTNSARNSGGGSPGLEAGDVRALVGVEDSLGRETLGQKRFRRVGRARQHDGRAVVFLPQALRPHRQPASQRRGRSRPDQTARRRDVLVFAKAVSDVPRRDVEHAWAGRAQTPPGALPGCRPPSRGKNRIGPCAVPRRRPGRRHAVSPRNSRAGRETTAAAPATTAGNAPSRQEYPGNGSGTRPLCRGSRLPAAAGVAPARRGPGRCPRSARSWRTEAAGAGRLTRRGRWMARSSVRRCPNEREPARGASGRCGFRLSRRCRLTACSHRMHIGLARRGYSPTGGAENYLRRLGGCADGARTLPDAFRQPGMAPRPMAGGRGFETVRGRQPARRSPTVSRALAPRGRCDLLVSLERVWSCDCYRAGDGVHRAWLERRARIEPRWRERLRALESQAPPDSRPGSVAFRPGRSAGRSLPTRGWSATRSSRTTRRSAGPDARSFTTACRRITSRPKPRPDANSTPPACGLEPDDYAILFAGTGWARKGLACALAAVARLPGHPAAAARRRAGQPTSVPAAAGTDAQRRGCSSSAPSRDMAAVYAAADVFCGPDALRSVFQCLPRSPRRRAAGADHPRQRFRRNPDPRRATARCSTRRQRHAGRPPCPLVRPGAATRTRDACAGEGSHVHHRGERRRRRSNVLLASRRRTRSLGL